jgi:hypothetical protein
VYTGYRGADVFRDLNRLRVPKITISRQGPSGTLAATSTTSAGRERGHGHGHEHEHEHDHLPPTLRRAGLFLLEQLRVWYQDKKTPIAKLTGTEARKRLIDQLTQYYNSTYPFDEALLATDTPQRWWARLDNDNSNAAQPLAVSHINCICHSQSSLTYVRNVPCRK